jgi:hypothetical protein
MAKNRSNAARLDAIRDGLKTAAKDFLAAVQRDYPGEKCYAFLFEVACEGSDAHGALATEEALGRHVTKMIRRGYRAKRGDDRDVALSGFRWAGPEDGWHQQPDAAFDVVNEIIGKAVQEGYYEMYDGTLERVCLAALRELDAEGVFGRVKERESVVLGVCYIGGDNSDEEFLGWAKEVNPPAVYRGLMNELKQSRKDMDRLISPSGSG